MLSDHSQASALESVLQHVSDCRSLCQRLELTPSDSSDPTHPLLFLYEFEARLHLGHTHLETVLDQVATLSSVEPKTFETIAGEQRLSIYGDINPCLNLLKSKNTCKCTLGHHTEATLLHATVARCKVACCMPHATCCQQIEHLSVPRNMLPANRTSVCSPQNVASK